MLSVVSVCACAVLLAVCCVVQVVGDCTLELTLSQFWSSLGSSSLEVELAFHGLGVEPAAGGRGGGSLGG